MRFFDQLLSVTTAIFLLLGASTAQTDELRSATGLPIQIGQPAIFGKVTIKGLSKEETKPLVFVSLLEGGSQLGRIQTNDAGYYYFLASPRGSATLVFEINSNEVGRMIVTGAPGVNRQLRQDITIDWQEFRQQASTGVISLKDTYQRDAANTRAFESAIQFVAEKNFDRAMALFESILSKDPKDYVVWTELGTLYFKANSLDNAEACYFKAIELKKDYFVALLNVGKLYYSQKRLDDAVVVLTNAVKSKPDSAEAFHYLGETYLQSKKGTLAVSALNEAIRLAPQEKADLHLRLASLYDAAGAKGKATMEYKSFLQKRPDYPDKAKLEKYIADNPPK